MGALDSEDRVNLAIVYRLGQEAAHLDDRKYRATAAFSYFSSVVLWVVQAGRNDGSKLISHQAAKLYLDNAEYTLILDALPDSVESAGMEETTVAEFLIWIRNCLAHVNSGEIRGWNVDGELKGFEFSSGGKMIRMKRRDMQNVVKSVCYDYCNLVGTFADIPFEEIALDAYHFEDRDE